MHASVIHTITNVVVGIVSLNFEETPHVVIIEKVVKHVSLL